MGEGDGARDFYGELTTWLSARNEDVWFDTAGRINWDASRHIPPGGRSCAKFCTASAGSMLFDAICAIHLHRPLARAG